MLQRRYTNVYTVYGYMAEWEIEKATFDVMEWMEEYGFESTEYPQNPSPSYISQRLRSENLCCLRRRQRPIKRARENNIENVFIGIRILRRCDINLSIRKQRLQRAVAREERWQAVRSTESDRATTRTRENRLSIEVVIMKRDNVNAINALCLFAAGAVWLLLLLLKNRQRQQHMHSTMRARHSLLRVKTVTLHICMNSLFHKVHNSHTYYSAKRTYSGFCCVRKAIVYGVYFFCARTHTH